jgi:hypothetical protein
LDSHRQNIIIVIDVGSYFSAGSESGVERAVSVVFYDGKIIGCPVEAAPADYNLAIRLNCYCISLVIAIAGDLSC